MDSKETGYESMAWNLLSPMGWNEKSDV
jgi:hypothetical protein